MPVDRKDTFEEGKRPSAQVPTQFGPTYQTVPSNFKEGILEDSA
eukprot:gene27454-33856_t